VLAAAVPSEKLVIVLSPTYVRAKLAISTFEVAILRYSPAEAEESPG
jgi:hypothetical protein